MNNKLTYISGRVQQTVLKHFEPIIEQFATEVEIHCKEKKTIHQLDSGLRQTDLWMDIFLRKPIANKTIHFAFYDGYNGNKDLFYDIDILIMTSDQKNNINSIKDYYKYLKLQYNFVNFFPQQGIEHMFQQLDIFLDIAEYFFKLPEIHSILYTDAWIDIPIDMSEYK